MDLRPRRSSIPSPSRSRRGGTPHWPGSDCRDPRQAGDARCVVSRCSPMAVSAASVPRPLSRTRLASATTSTASSRISGDRGAEGSDFAGDAAGHIGGLPREVADGFGHDGETLALLARTGGDDAGVDGENPDLRRDIADARGAPFDGLQAILHRRDAGAEAPTHSATRRLSFAGGLHPRHAVAGMVDGPVAASATSATAAAAAPSARSISVAPPRRSTKTRPAPPSPDHRPVQERRDIDDLETQLAQAVAQPPARPAILVQPGTPFGGSPGVGGRSRGRMGLLGRAAGRRRPLARAVSGSSLACRLSPKARQKA
jgi:hypothetical protein